MKVLLMVLFLACASAAMAFDATVSFTDNSANEQGFKVERNLNGGAFAPLATLAANITQMIDTTLVQGAADNRYCYRVYAFNTAGNSGYANPASPGSDCKVVPAQVVIPINPSGLLVQ